MRARLIIKEKGGLAMGKKEKLIQHLLSQPKNFTFSEAETLLGYFGYYRSNKGRTSGSRVMFIRDNGVVILLHKPHPGNELKAYQVKQLIQELKKEGLI